MCEFYLLSSLEKVLLTSFDFKDEHTSQSALLGERVSFQIAYRCKKWGELEYKIKVESELADKISFRRVESVPAVMPAYRDHYDDDYITRDATLIPDVLLPLEDDMIEAQYDCWRTLWVTVEGDEKIKSGTYPIKIIFEGKEIVEKTFTIEYINAVLPKQDLTVTQWFHCDCIATHYGIEMLSDEHFKRIEDFIKVAVRNGINMILTPIFTPPLDTAVGGERPTVQLVDMSFIDGTWSFGYEKFDRFVNICNRCGVKYFEMAHLFTQWGAYFTPKIVAKTENGMKRVFGWDVRSDSDEYKYFLSQFLPSLRSHLRKLGIEDRCVFHISDEPGDEHLASYKGCRETVMKYLDGCYVMDALSHYDFYEQGIVEHPVVATECTDDFLKNNVPNLWVYYCCMQRVDTCNRFMAMPSYRNRIIATQFFKYDVAGFLQWGYNFYYSPKSKRYVNPYMGTGAEGGFPSGDSYSVYPTPDGCAESLRIVVFHEAIQDLGAFKLLASMIGKDKVVKMIEDEAGMEIRFNRYPRGIDKLYAIREKINQEIQKNI